MFERLELLIGEKINILKNKTVLVLGLGGVGGYVVESLVRSGIENIIIVDYDKVDITNLNRQIIALNSNIGRLKTDCFIDRIKDININCKVKKYDLFYNKENKDILFENDIDYVIDCCDSVEAKTTIILECLKRKIKIISCCGTGNKLDCTLFRIDKLKKTNTDPLAKKLRLFFKDNKDALNVNVLFSTELPKKGLNHIGSIMNVVASAGLLISNYVIKELMEE